MGCCAAYGTRASPRRCGRGSMSSWAAAERRERRHSEFMISRRRFLQWLASLGIVGAAASAYAFAIEPLSRPRVTRYDLKLDRWPNDLHLTVAVVADVHACKPWMEVERIESIVGHIN